MGWYLRKSVRMGPVRWNLSKSGIGMSVGVRGLRVGTGPRGSYIAGGRGGLYFRQPLSGATTRSTVGQRSPAGALLPAPPATPTMHIASGAPVEYLPETQVNAFTPATADTLARYITAQRANVPFFWWAVGILTVINLIVLINQWPIAVLAILTIPASVYLAYVTKQWDRQRTHVVLHYELDAVEAASFQQLCAGLQALSAVVRLARVESRQVHGDWKRNAGATTSLQVSPATVLPPGSIPWLETNVPVWSLRWHQGHLALMFLPDRILIEQGQVTAAVPYTQVQMTTEVRRWIEQGRVPPDARVLSYTWQYTNKDGSPDRRFKANRQLPVIEAIYLGFQNASGLNLLLQASNCEKVTACVQGFHSFRPLICAEPPVVA